MSDATYDQLKAQAILGCETAGEIMESLDGVTDPRVHQVAREMCHVILAGALVYATLAQAEAEKDSMREFQERVPKRTNVAPRLRPVPMPNVDNINKFQKDEEK